MKILIINPNSDSNTDRIMAEKAKKLALPEVEVVVKHCENAPKLVGNWAGAGKFDSEYGRYDPCIR